MIDMDNPVLDLTAMDRCDRCGAQALVVAGHEDHKSDLLFCGHHIRIHKDSLYAQGWSLVADGEMAEKIGYKDDSVIRV